MQQKGFSVGDYIMIEYNRPQLGCKLVITGSKTVKTEGLFT